MGFIQNLSEIFWSPDIWLPPNVTWSDIAPGSQKNVSHADYRHILFWPIPLSIGMLILRHFVEKHWFAPIGKSLGIRCSRPKRPAPNELLEKAYKTSSKLSHKNIVSLAKQGDLSERQVERWWRLRRAQDKPSTLVKFCENSWRCLYYTCSFAYGLLILWNKSWFWNIKDCWYGYPHQSIDNDVWWYYMTSMSFYCALTVSQFVDVKRKDFWQMFVHHMVTLLLMALSWVCNLHRVGSLVLVVHDCADIFLEAAKITKYANYQKICDIIFAVFTVIWIVTRLGFYPRIIYSSSIEAPRILPMFPAYYIFNSLLVMLLLLHIAWTYLILQIAYNALKAGQMEGDIRSSSSNVSDSAEEKPISIANGSTEKSKLSPKK